MVRKIKRITVNDRSWRRLPQSNKIHPRKPFCCVRYVGDNRRSGMKNIIVS